MDSYPVVKLQSLDKITARTMTFEANVGNTVKFGSLYIKIQACKKAPPVEQPEAAAFLQIWEVKPSPGAARAKEDSQWVFSGWMFSSSPALSHMDHPIYDVWITDCKGGKSPTVAEAPAEAPKEPARQQQQRRTQQPAPLQRMPPPPGPPVR